MKNRVMPTTYFIILLILLIVVHFAFPTTEVIFSPYTYLGAFLIVFGIVMNIWADNLFKKNKTTVKPHEMPSFLVTSGPFSISRHPMYCGMAAILFGVAIFLGSISSFIFPPIFIILMEAIFIPQEEKNVSKKFGSKYLAYKKNVRKWI